MNIPRSFSSSISLILLLLLALSHDAGAQTDRPGVLMGVQASASADTSPVEPSLDPVAADVDRVAFLRERTGRAREYYHEGEYEKALRVLDPALEVYENEPALQGILVLIESRMGRHAKALERAKRLQLSQTGDTWFSLLVVECHLISREYDKAEEILQALAGSGRADGEKIAFYRALTSALAGKPDDAAVHAETIQFPSDTPAYYHANAVVEYAAGRADKGGEWVASGVHIFGEGANGSYLDIMRTCGLLGTETRQLLGLR